MRSELARDWFGSWSSSPSRTCAHYSQKPSRIFRTEQTEPKGSCVWPMKRRFFDALLISRAHLTRSTTERDGGVQYPHDPKRTALLSTVSRRPMNPALYELARK